MRKVTHAALLAIGGIAGSAMLVGSLITGCSGDDSGGGGGGTPDSSTSDSTSPTPDTGTHPDTSVGKDTGPGSETGSETGSGAEGGHEGGTGAHEGGHEGGGEGGMTTEGGVDGGGSEGGHSEGGGSEGGTEGGPEGSTTTDASDGGAGEGGDGGPSDAGGAEAGEAGPCNAMWPDGGTNVVTNPDFESTTDAGAGWSTPFGGTFGVSSNAYCGAHSGEVSGRSMFYQGIFTSIPATPATYNVAVWVLQDGTAAATLNYGQECLGADGSQTFPGGGPAVSVPANTWTLLSGTLTVPSGCASVEFFVSQASGATTFPDLFVDEVFVGQ
jgi:hypothetical protein